MPVNLLANAGHFGGKSNIMFVIIISWNDGDVDDEGVFI